MKGVKGEINELRDKISFSSKRKLIGFMDC